MPANKERSLGANSSLGLHGIDLLSCIAALLSKWQPVMSPISPRCGLREGRPDSTFALLFTRLKGVCPASSGAQSRGPGPSSRSCFFCSSTEGEPRRAEVGTMLPTVETVERRRASALVSACSRAQFARRLSWLALPVLGLPQLTPPRVHACTSLGIFPRTADVCEHSCLFRQLNNQASTVREPVPYPFNSHKAAESVDEALQAGCSHAGIITALVHAR